MSIPKYVPFDTVQWTIENPTYPLTMPQQYRKHFNPYCDRNSPCAHIHVQ